MSASLSDLMAELAEAGAPMKAILIAVRAVEAERMKDDDRRAKRAEQKRKERSRTKEEEATVARQSHDNSATVATASQDSAQEPFAREDRIHARACVFPVGLSNDNPPLVTPLPTVGPQGGRSPRGHALPDDWSPPEELFAYGAAQGLTREQTGSIIEDYRLWALANRNRPIARKSDWLKAFMGAIRRDAAKFRSRAGPPQIPRQAQRGGAAHNLAILLENERHERQQAQIGFETAGELSVISGERPDDGGCCGSLIRGAIKRF